MNLQYRILLALRNFVTKKPLQNWRDISNVFYTNHLSLPSLLDDYVHLNKLQFVEFETIKLRFDPDFIFHFDSDLDPNFAQVLSQA